jgi:hypothetical protein
LANRRLSLAVKRDHLSRGELKGLCRCEVCGGTNRRELSLVNGGDGVRKPELPLDSKGTQILVLGPCPHTEEGGQHGERAVTSTGVHGEHVGVVAELWYEVGYVDDTNPRSVLRLPLGASHLKLDVSLGRMHRQVAIHLGDDVRGREHAGGAEMERLPETSSFGLPANETEEVMPQRPSVDRRD